MNNIMKFNSTFEYKLIYVFGINDGKHEGCVKIGDATLYSSKPYTDFLPNCHDLNYAARQRIDAYTSTAGIIYELLHTEIAIYTNSKGQIKAFRDYKVHEVLKRSGISVKKFQTNKIQNEWFECDLTTAKNAIKAVKCGKSALNSSQITNNQNPIIFRPEQKDAIKKTINRYKNDTKMLWNAKMRFGKTLTALEVAKEMDFKKTIIITHRPVVSEGWFEDFKKIFYDRPDYLFGSKTKGYTIEELLKNNDKFVFFASMQDLRGSDTVGGNFNKNDEIFNTDWDFVVVDEAHEGTKTNLGKNVLEKVIKEDKNDKHKTYVLELSGTPFNLLTDFEQESIYTWDYIMEQEAKMNWDKYHFGDSNPYEELPKMNIYTYHLEKSLPAYIDVMDKAFNFKEFFRIWTGNPKLDGNQIPENESKGNFIHEKDMIAFLDLICKQDQNTNYPFSTDEYRNYFRHSLWCVPGVKEAKALSKLLKKHHIFKNFKIINVAGDGDEEIDTGNALKAVKEAMTDNPNETYTITLSCGRLTTGVSVPEWTAVLMLAGTYSTAASQYLQTIFRVQTPANINGKIKEECFVFDFAPDRTLKMVAESVQLSARAGSKNPVAEISLSKFLNYCPVIAIENSNMKEYKVAELLQELKKAYAERVVRNGFDDAKIYNDDLLKLNEVELKEFEKLKKIVGTSKQTKKSGDIDINKEGFSKEEIEEETKLKKKPKEQLTDDEKKKLEDLKEKRKNRDSAISILRAISIRMPLLVYGMDIDINTDVTIENFADLIDDISWEEFMPKGVNKEMFKKFSKYYDKDIFVAASRRIRYIAKTADELEPTDRVKKIAGLFATFKNPDKETVLTPWRVVNMHMSQTLGGYCFFDDKFESELDQPRYVDNGSVTDDTLNNPKSNILEINSKTGLYPLYVTYSIYRAKCSNDELSFEEKQKIWDETVNNNIYVICKTPMAKLITQRTLLGYRKGKINAHAFDDLINQMKEKQSQLISKIKSSSFWNKGGKEMKFNAVVGNPPYQVETAKHQSETNGQSRSKSIFQYFQMTSDLISSGVVSLIYPGARWIHRSGKGMEQFGKDQINDRRLYKLIFYPNANDIFKDAAIADGISIVFKIMDKKDSYFKYEYVTNNSTISVNLKLPGDKLIPLNPADEAILQKVDNFVINNKLTFMHDRVLSQKLFGIESDFVEKNPDKVRKYSKGMGIDFSKEVLLFANDKAGKAGRSMWFVTSKDNIQSNKQLINEWQVVVSSANAGGQKRNNQLEIIDNHSVFGRSRVALGSFKTEKEANNFYNYVKTDIIKFMFLMTDESLGSLGKRVPDLQNYDDSSIVTFDEHLGNNLNKLIGLSEEEITYIKSKIRQ